MSHEQFIIQGKTVWSVLLNVVVEIVFVDNAGFGFIVQATVGGKLKTNWMCSAADNVHLRETELG